MADSSYMMADSSMAPDTSSMMDSSMMDDDTSSATDMAPTTRTPVVLAQGYTQVDTDRLATKIIGSPVYASAAADAENFGNITDLVLDQNGEIAAVVLGVGGFLGIGEKQVAVDFSALQWVVAADNTERFTLATTKDELTSAPDFTTADDQPAQSNAPAATTAPAPADNGAMAPADAMSSSAAM
jgi:hypothetical protein